MLQELENQSLLVLYLADELSAKDRAEVESRLAADAALRAELAQLEAATQSFQEAMAAHDGAARPSDAAVARRIGQAMRQHLARQLSAPPMPAAQPVEQRNRYPWWAYSGAAAAVVLVTFLSWWGQRTDSPMRIGPDKPVAIAPIPSDEVARVERDIEDNFDDANPTQPEKSVAALNATEDQIVELSRSQTEFRYTDGNE